MQYIYLCGEEKKEKKYFLNEWIYGKIYGFKKYMYIKS